MTQSNQRGVRWLKSQLPELVAGGVISSDNARAIERHYESSESRSNFGFVLLAGVGTALVCAGIILLIAHNWDDLSRGTRTAIAFLPLITAQGLGAFVLMRRNQSQAWRESAAIFIVASIAIAISLVSQTYQIQGTFADFMSIWLLLSIPMVYIFRSTAIAAAYILGTVVWLFARIDWSYNRPERLVFWLLLVLELPYIIGVFRRNRESGEFTFLSILFVGAAAIGLGYTAELARANFGGISFAGFFAGTYLLGMKFFPRDEHERLHPLAFLGGIGVRITTIVLSFENLWHMAGASREGMNGGFQSIAIAIELFFPVAAILLFAIDYFHRRKVAFSLAVILAPLVTALAWAIANLAPAAQRANDSAYSFAAALLMNLFALCLGIELMARGIRAGSIARANFGLLVIAVLALARFFDNDLSFLVRGFGFIIVGIGFLLANFIFFKKRIRV